MPILMANRLFIVIFCCLMSIGAFAHDYTLGNLDIHHPWIRATPAGAEVAGGYMDLTNAGSSEDRLVSIEIAGIKMAAIHEMAVIEGVMKMRPLPSGLTLNPGETVSLKPGSFHIMMMGLSKPLLAGEKVSGTLHFEKAGSIDIEFRVESMGFEPEAQHHHAAAPAN